MFLSSPSTNWMFTISHWNIWTGLRNINYLVIINIYFLILQVRSFNFLVSDSTKYKHLANQYYKACIRREAGYCKIAWSASSDPDSFKIRKVSKCQTFSSFIRKMWKISTNFIAYFLPKFSILWNWHWHFVVPSRPDGNYNSNTGTAGCIPDFVMIPGSSNFGNEDGTCLTPGNTAQVTIDRSDTFRSMTI